MLCGCTRSELPPTQRHTQERFTEAQATASADTFLAEQETAWGKPAEIRPHEVNGNVIQYTLYYDTPTGEDTRLGKRGLIVTREGQVSRTVRR